MHNSIIEFNNKSENNEFLLQAEIASIDSRLNEINRQIKYLEQEKYDLLARKKECLSSIKESMPSSSGGKKKDSLSEWNRVDFKWSDQVKNCLQKIFKLNEFRPLQLETINVTMSSNDCIVIMPTGGGKSLCFQLPSVIDTGVTLVVSPLISLVEDQLWFLKSLNMILDLIINF